MQQKERKPKRRFKKDALRELEDCLGKKIDGLDRLTIACMDNLRDAIKELKC